METLTAASFSSEQRQQLARSGEAMKDGSFPIRNRGDLRNAIRAIGRASNPEAARAHIIARAKALKLTAMLPSDWAVTADGGFFNQLADALISTGGMPGYGTTDVPAMGVFTLPDQLTAALPLAVAGEPNIGLAPLIPPDEWFEDPKLDGPTPLTITADGRVFGHLAQWGKCHRGIQGRCVMAPRTKNGYADFHGGGKILTASGSQVPVGKLTVNAHHASLTIGAQAAAAHYDHTGSVAAFVRAGEDKYGPWLAGATRSDATPEQIRDLRANPPSGDWRNTEGKGLELVAALAVPVPGFPVMAVAASIDVDGYEHEEPQALIMGWADDQPLAITAAYVEAEHPRDPGGPGGGQWIRKAARQAREREQFALDAAHDADESGDTLTAMRLREAAKRAKDQADQLTQAAQIRTDVESRPDLGGYPMATGEYTIPLQPGDYVSGHDVVEGSPEHKSYHVRYQIPPGSETLGTHGEAFFATKTEALDYVKRERAIGNMDDYAITPSAVPLSDVTEGPEPPEARRMREYFEAHRPPPRQPTTFPRGKRIRRLSPAVAAAVRILGR